MLNLSSHITIGEEVSRQVVDLTVSSSVDTLTDTCEISFPRKIRWGKGKKSIKITDVIKRGDSISIQTGYDGRLNTVFTGFIRNIDATIPVRLECEDHAYLLKKSPQTISLENATLRELLDAALPSVVPIEAQPDRVGLGPIRFTNMTAAKILDEIKKSYFMKFWFREGRLYAGQSYWNSTLTEHVIRFDKHVVSNDLQYMIKDDIQIKLKVIHVTPDNQRQEFEYGDPEGDQRTIYLYDNDKSSIDQIASQQIERMRYTGYRGSIEIFGEPFVRHGDIVELIDEQYPERQGKYFVRAVDTYFGVDGYRQTLKLDTQYE